MIYDNKSKYRVKNVFIRYYFDFYVYIFPLYFGFFHFTAVFITIALHIIFCSNAPSYLDFGCIWGVRNL